MRTINGQPPPKPGDKPAPAVAVAAVASAGTAGRADGGGRQPLHVGPQLDAGRFVPGHDSLGRDAERAAGPARRVHRAPHGGRRRADAAVRHREAPAAPDQRRRSAVSVGSRQPHSRQGERSQPRRDQHPTDQDATSPRAPRTRRRKCRTPAAKLAQALSAVEEDVYQVRNQSGQDPLNFPIKTNNRLASLLRVAVSGEGRPTGNVEPIFNELIQELKEHTDRLDRTLATELPAFNRMLERNKKGADRPK